MKLALGTVQFGLNYGISNSQGKTPSQEVTAILEYASQNGVTVLDTAPLYGNSEEVLGGAFKKGFGRIVTKTMTFSRDTITERDGKYLEETFAKSLLLLQQKDIYGLLIHHADDLLKSGGEHLFFALQRLQSQGLVNKIGVSVYTKVQIDKVLDRFPIDIIQLPINVFDQRLLQDGSFEKLKQKNVEIHGRSAFLQGALLMDSTKLPKVFEPVQQELANYHSFITEHDLTSVQAALGFVCNLDLVDYVICGVNNLKQWKELVAAAQINIDPYLFSAFAIGDTKILNPAMWEV